MKQALLIVDVQKDYFQGGRNELVHAYEAALQVRELIAAFRKKKEPIIYVQHISLRENVTFFINGTEGIEISELIPPQSTDIIIVKHTPDSFLQTSLQQQLQALGVKSLVICGMMTHMCIDTTVRAAKGLGYEVTLIEDACATKDLIWNGEVVPADMVQKTYMASLDGSFARVMKTKNFVEQ